MATIAAEVWRIFLMMVDDFNPWPKIRREGVDGVLAIYFSIN